VAWARRYILFHDKRHPDEMGGPEIASFLSHLAVDEHVAASTQNQALSAILFLYRHVLKRDVRELGEGVRASGRRAVPIVLSRHEVRAVLAELHGTKRLIGTLFYGSGTRLLEALQLRVKELDFERSHFVIRAGKGRRQCITTLPLSLADSLREHLRDVRNLARRDAERGARRRCPTLLRGSTRAPAASGRGSGCSRQPASRPTAAPAPGSAGTFTRPSSSAR